MSQPDRHTVIYKAVSVLSFLRRRQRIRCFFGRLIRPDTDVAALAFVNVRVFAERFFPDCAGALIQWLGITFLLATRKDDESDDEKDERAAETTDDKAAEQHEEEVSVMRTELPFGPFLAMAAVFFLFAESWIVVKFNLFGG